MHRSIVNRYSLLVLVLSVLFLANISQAYAGAKRRIAVMPFDYGAVTSEVGSVDVGKGVTSLLITKLVNDGTYSIVDRQMLDSILKEQNLSVSDRADPTTACKIGKILSVDAIIVGTVTQFGFETKTSKIGGLSGLGSSAIPYAGGYSSFGLGAVGVRKSKARVAIDARLIDINTSEILAAIHGAGESKRGGATLFSGAGPDFSDSGFGSSIAGEATLQAVDQIGNQLIALAAKIPDNQSLAAANVSGKIADVTGTTVVVNVGKNNGVAVGDNLRVTRVYKTIKDPVTGNVIKELSKTIAVVTISDVDNTSATGTIVKGDGVQVGDSANKVSLEVSAIVLDAPQSTSTTTTTTTIKSSSAATKRIK